MNKIIDFFVGLWNSNKTLYKVLFWVLLPLVAIAFFLKLNSSINIDAGQEEIAKAKEDDAKLEKDQLKADLEATMVEKEADDLEKKVQENRDS